MSRVALVVSDVDGTLLTKDKTLTDGARSAVKRLHDAGLAFTIISSRPIIGMRFLIAPLGLTLPIGAFNGSSIVDPRWLGIRRPPLPRPRHERDRPTCRSPVRAPILRRSSARRMTATRRAKNRHG